MLLLLLTVPKPNDYLWAQEGCYGVAEDENAEAKSLNCANNSPNSTYPKYYLHQYYTTTPDNYENVPIRTIRLNIHIIRRGDLSGNFQDTPADLAFLTSIIDGTEGINERFQALSIPTRTQPCVCGTECYIPDSRIRFALKGIYFHESDDNYINGSLDFYANNSVNPDKELNIFIHGNQPDASGVFNIGAGTNILGGTIDNNGTVDQQALSANIRIYAKNYSHAYLNGTINTVSICHNLAHELGHALGLLHTYEPTCCHESNNPITKDFLTDVFGTGSSGCPNDAWHQFEGGIGCTIPVGEPHSCSNNLVGQSWQGGHYLSPQQLGRIHRNMHLMRIRRYVEDCNQSSIPWEIAQNELWDFDIRMFEDIIVKPGATLTITCAVRMPRDARIVVERGAKLIVDGGLITNACENERWQGIEVWGNTTPTGRSHQQIFNNAEPDLLAATDYVNVSLLPDDPGMVVLINEAKIENGPNGAISTQKSSEGWNEAFWGGIVYANNAMFDNNKRAVAFMRYIPRNYSRFIGCTFTAKDDYPFTTWQGVTMWATNDVQFSRCIFSHNLPNRKGEGVGGLDAAFTVRDNCMFQNLDKGIDAEATMPLSGNVVVGSPNAAQGNSFGNNAQHIRAKSIDKLDVQNNLFGLTTVQSGFGILASNGTQGRVHNNTFTNTTNGIVSITNPRGTFSIDCNDFYNNELAIWALGNNRAVVFDANEFFNTAKFDAVLSSVGTEQGDWRDAHGSLLEPRFNLFSSNLSQDHIATINFFSGVQTLFFNYYHPTPTLNSRLVPVCDDDDGGATPNNYHNQDVGTVPISEVPTCIDIDGLIGGGGGDEFCQSKECLENLKVYINDLKNNIDGGDKEQLIADLSAYPNSQATYQNLYDGSPYLSDSLLLQIAQTTGMADWKRSNLLVINSPLSDEVMIQIIEYVPAYTYQILESIRYYDQLSERGVLESRISEEERKKAAILSTLLTEMLQQKNYAEMADLVADEDPEYALRTLSAAQLHLGNPTQAQTILDQIPIFDAEDQQFYDIQSINIARATQAQFDLSPEQEAVLRQIANDYYSSQAGYAQGLLRLYRDEQIDIVLPDIEDGTHTATSGKTQVATRNKARFSADELNSLMLFPNPAASVATFYLPTTADNSTLEVRDIQGNNRASVALTPGQRIGQLDVSELPNGLYWVSLQNGNKTISSAKLIVVH